MSDPFKRFTPGLDSPPAGGISITPSDSSDLPTVTRALNVGSTGTVRVTTLDGSNITLTIAAGVMFPVRVTKVWTTGTSAQNITGLL